MKLIISATAAALVLTALPADAAASAAERPMSASIPKAAVKSSSSVVTEGDRITLRVRVPQSEKAKRVVLQERVTSIFSTSWQDVDSKRARSRLKFRHTVTATNEAVYRVAVTYQSRVKPVLSRAAKITVWRWIPLREFPAYFETTSLVGHGSDTMNGAAYETWGLHYSIGGTRAWESRITPGRNCTAFRAVLGLSDRSDDGSSGTVSFSADDVLLYQSPSLTPGMTVPVTLDLARPYRFGMTATNTSPDKVKAYPMVGNGELYCTGIED